jgi:RNA polymerase sigma-70 factor (ECF subfamily)
VLEEDEILARCRRGDSAAWDDLFNAHYSAAGRFIFQLSPSLSMDDVEEISQETFLAVVRGLGNFHGGSAFRTWLFRIAANKTRDFLQKSHAAKRGGGEMAYSLDAPDPVSGLKLDPRAPLPGPDGIIMNMERMGAVRNALDLLGEPCREIIELKYFGDLSYQEIASELKLNPKTVSSRLSKCLDKLEEIARPLLNRENMASPSV